MNSETPLLIPFPRSLKLLGGYRPWPPAPNINAHDDEISRFAAGKLAGRVSFGRQADVLIRLEDARPRHPGEYAMRIEASGAVRITARDRAGCLHAVATLAQLARQFGDRLPLAIIHDHPSFAHRGVMLDVSRDRVPRMDHLRRVVEQLAELKFNHLQLYTEHTFAYPGHSDAWEGASPMTADEVRRLDDHCAAHAITLAANQNCFGHLASWLRLPRYRELAEIPGLDDPWNFYAWERRGPFSLCPTDPRSADFIDGLLGDLLPHFGRRAPHDSHQRLCNINCDETFDVGQGRSRHAADRDSRANLYFDFLDKVAASVRARGFRPMFWADIALSHPDAIDRIPPDMVCLAWDYEPQARFGEWCRLLKGRAGRETWVCPGTSSWRSFTGRTTERRGNIDAAAREGVAGGAAGMLICDWGDIGHRQTWPISLHGIADAAQAAWTGTSESTPPREVSLAAESLHVLGDRSLQLASWLDAWGDVDADLRRVGGPRAQDASPSPLRNATLMFHDYHLPWIDPEPRGSEAAWRDAEDRLDSLAAAMPTQRCSPLIADELAHSVRCARAALRRGVLRRSSLDRGLPAPGELHALADMIREVQHHHARLWRIRSREGGLAKSLSHDAVALRELEQVAGASA